ncbi:tRNA pseudouridine(38-40) synthase TruA [candidate division KSB1 bacterium]|nr:tRNA pseudouridine(38-40) synthase TruA [candidate division KSB1 bacterium]RQW01656.1 MAG: tRNA pseudouridine(38-40) synthase TruA [candidate division KSB1 bacterium]
MRNIKLIIEYDGTNFCGYQIQPNERTVQAELERSLSMLTTETIRLTAAGRTDSGVHALGQVVNFKTKSRLPIEAFVRGGNTRLPKDIRILLAEDVPEDFSARYSAKSRTYRYVITRKSQAIGRHYAWYYWNQLDVKKMRAACADILGSQNFASFCQAKAEVDHYICDVRYAYWQQIDNRLIFEICANRFLHNMVRTLVGTMVEIGDVQLQTANMREILLARDRRAAGQTAPAHGLFFVRVDY